MNKVMNVSWERAFCAAAVILLVTVTPAYGQNPDEKIDPELMEVLAGDQSAPFFVLFRERGVLEAASRIPEKAERARQVVQSLLQTAEASQRGVRGLIESRDLEYTPFWVMNAIFIPSGDLALARVLAARPEVAGIKPEPVFAIPDVVSEPAAATQVVEWNMAKIRADQVWETTTGEGVVVANIDTGVRYTHDALVNQYRGNTGTGFDHDGNWSDPTGRCKSGPCDNVDHGTHTMGTMVGSGGIGVAPGAQWIACKGCATGQKCFGSDLVACAQWVMDPLGGADGAGQPDVVNNSWGGSSGSDWFLSFVQSWRAAGIFPAFSAGNSGPSCESVGSPGDYAISFAAGATNNADQVALFSARGPSAFGVVKPDVSAPGVSVNSSIATSDNSYAAYSGTSMASPHVAGTVALVWASKPSLKGNVAATERLLRENAVPLISSEDCGGTAYQLPGNVYGSGRLDALQSALSGDPILNAPTVTVSEPANGESFSCPAEVQFGGTATDPEDGDLSAQLLWSDNGTALGMGPSLTKTYECSEIGDHNVLAQVIDSTGMFDVDAIQVLIRAACFPSGVSCSSDTECCSGRCKGKKGAKTCK